MKCIVAEPMNELETGSNKDSRMIIIRPEKIIVLLQNLCKIFSYFEAMHEQK